MSDRQTDEQTDGRTDDGEEMPVPIPAAGDAITHGKVCKTTTYNKTNNPFYLECRLSNIVDKTRTKRTKISQTMHKARQVIKMCYNTILHHIPLGITCLKNEFTII